MIRCPTIWRRQHRSRTVIADDAIVVCVYIPCTFVYNIGVRGRNSGLPRLVDDNLGYG